jgi:hypothetical protein
LVISTDTFLWFDRAYCWSLVGTRWKLKNLENLVEDVTKIGSF